MKKTRIGGKKNKTNTAKIGALFIVSAMALAGVGAGYAAWFDTITITGTVSTGSVEWEVIDYSGTYVWKIWDPDYAGPLSPDYGTEIYVTGDPDYNPTQYGATTGFKRVAYAEAMLGTGDYDVEVVFVDLFPCIDFIADIEILYTGTVPGKINDISFEVPVGYEWINELILSGDIYATARCNGEVVELGYQLHEGDIIHIELHVHIPQDNDLMFLSGSFTASFEVIQWNEYVPPAPPLPPVYNLNKNTYYDSIQDAVDDASTGNIILVSAVELTETGQIVIDKDLTIKGAGVGNTIIKKNEDTGNTGSGDGRGWFLVPAGKTLTLQDVTLDGVGNQICIGVLSYGTVTIKDCEIKNIGWTPSSYYGRGVCIYGGTSNLVSGTTFSNILRIGVFTFGAGVSSTIDGCTYNGKGAGDWLDYGFEAGGGAGITVENSMVSGCTGVATVDGSTSAGILVTTYFAAGTTADITYSTFTGNTDGIAIGYDAADTSTVVANYNNIYGNTAYGLSSTAPTVDAENNWWGHSSGPTHSGNPGGSGDAVSDYVDYDPWAAAAYP